MRKGGLEPPHPFEHQDLNLACLPIPPLPRARQHKGCLTVRLPTAGLVRRPGTVVVVATPAPQRRGALIALVIVAALTCLALGWWQWSRFQSTGGTGQNLGYALQWPLFAGFCVYAYRKFVRLESGEPKDETSARPRLAAPTELPPGLLPTRPAARAADERPTSEYNTYLAELSEQDARDAPRSSR